MRVGSNHWTCEWVFYEKTREKFLDPFNIGSLKIKFKWSFHVFWIFRWLFIIFRKRVLYGLFAILWAFLLFFLIFLIKESFKLRVILTSFFNFFSDKFTLLRGLFILDWNLFIGLSNWGCWINSYSSLVYRHFNKVKESNKEQVNIDRGLNSCHPRSIDSCQAESTSQVLTFRLFNLLTWLWRIRGRKMYYNWLKTWWFSGFDCTILRTSIKILKVSVITFLSRIQNVVWANSIAGWRVLKTFEACFDLTGTWTTVSIHCISVITLLIWVKCPISAAQNTSFWNYFIASWAWIAYSSKRRWVKSGAECALSIRTSINGHRERNIFCLSGVSHIIS